MQSTPSANRLHIVVLGRRNAGKSTLVNALTGQAVSLVSPVKGTTTDPVRKPMELWPLGPVLLIDTPGLDDEGELGEKRVSAARDMLERADIALLVARAGEEYGLESACLEELRARNVPVLLVENTEDDQCAERDARFAPLEALGAPVVRVNARAAQGLDALREALVQHAPVELEPPTLAAHLVQPGDAVLLVAPQDIQAPKGRLILPQQQVLRDLLDGGAVCVMVRATELEKGLEALANAPALVITDSQVFGQVAAKLPPGARLTSFSVLMARAKGDMALYVQGAQAIDALRPGDRVLIAEACSHQPLDGDIGRVKLPAMLQKRAGGGLDITVSAGADFPKDVTGYRLVIHCGGCMFNRRHVLSRVMRCAQQGVPVTNYGVAIAHMQGILEKVIW